MSPVHPQRADEAAPVQTDTVAQRRRLHGEGRRARAQPERAQHRAARRRAPTRGTGRGGRGDRHQPRPPPRSPNLVRNLNNRGLALEDLGDPPPAEYAELAALRATLPDLDGNARSQSDFFYGRWLSRAGRLQEACPCWPARADYRRRAMPPAHVDRVESELELAELHRRRGAVSDAAAPAEAAGAALPALEAGSVPPRLQSSWRRGRGALQAARQPASAAEVAAHMSTALGLAPPACRGAAPVHRPAEAPVRGRRHCGLPQHRSPTRSPGWLRNTRRHPWRARVERLQAQLSDARKP